MRGGVDRRAPGGINDRFVLAGAIQNGQLVLRDARVILVKQLLHRRSFAKPRHADGVGTQSSL